MISKTILIIALAMAPFFLFGQQAITSSHDFSENWETIGSGRWNIENNNAIPSKKGRNPAYKMTWIAGSDSTGGLLRSPSFKIEKAFQLFDIAGLYGAPVIPSENEQHSVRLCSFPGGEILRETRVNAYDYLTSERWFTKDLIGKKVFLEINGSNVHDQFRNIPMWMAFENYRQEDQIIPDVSEQVNLYGVKIDENAFPTLCRSIPFLTAMPAKRGETKRHIEGLKEIIPINAKAEQIYLLGMINQAWENGVHHWSLHPELVNDRKDQNYIGKEIGAITIQYADGDKDLIPLVTGISSWFVAHWAHGGSHGVADPCMEPFASRPEYKKVLEQSLKLYEDQHLANFSSEHQYYYLAVKPQNKLISSIIIDDSPELIGRPLISAITIAGKKQKGLYNFGKLDIDPADLKPKIDVNGEMDWAEDIHALADVLYTSDKDMPENVDPISFPDDMDASGIRFLGGKEAGWLSNIWTANLIQIHEKFDIKTGFFHETGEDCPWYGGYSGIGTWSIQGIYPNAYARTSDHFVTLALRCINEPLRETSYVDFCDKYLYFYRDNNDPDKGPENTNIDVTKYPPDAPPHWAMEINDPAHYLVLNEIPGVEEMDGHASTIVGRWTAWRLAGKPTGDWLKQSRDSVYNISRWQATKDATEYICWQMDYTGMDLIYSEGEFTGWGGITDNFCLIPEGMSTETDPIKIKENYAKSNMYEPYPNYTCMIALKCAAQMATAMNDAKLAKKWEQYAERIKSGMLRQLISGDFNSLTWRISPYSILTSFQDRLVQAWFSIYYDGYDPSTWDPEMTKITRNTFYEHMDKPYGHAPALAMGYGQGWLTKAALLLDEMDDASPLLINIARYTYDKNMNYVDTDRGIDWRKWMWIIPEGANILPDGSWYRINDLSNGANQGPAMHALEVCAGVDDTNPHNLKIMPRVPEPLTGIEVNNFFTLVPEGENLVKARINYTYKKGESFLLSSNISLPTLSVRLGPFSAKAKAMKILEQYQFPEQSSQRIESSGHFQNQDAWWIWLEGMKNIKNVEIKQ